MKVPERQESEPRPNSNGPKPCLRMPEDGFSKRIGGSGFQIVKQAGGALQENVKDTVDWCLVDVTLTSCGCNTNVL